MDQTYFQTPYLVLQYNDQEKYTAASWQHFPLSDEFRAGMDQIIRVMEEKKIGKVLTDTRKMGAISPDDQDWSINDWLPRAFAAGYRRIAIVISEDIFNQMSVEDIMSRVEGVDFVTKYFPSLEAGRQWLATQ
jgi:hypothetical protein